MPLSLALKWKTINLHCNLWVAIIFYYVPHFFKVGVILFISDPIINDQIPSTHLEACITRASQKELKHTIQIHIEKLVQTYYYLTKLGGAKNHKSIPIQPSLMYKTINV